MNEYQDATRRLAAEVGRANARIAELERQIEDLNKKILGRDDLIDCIALVQDKRSESLEKMEQAATEIVALADAPESEEFRQAVCSHRSAKSDCEYYNNLIDRLEAAK